jgi:hypothetical protein
MTRAAKILYFTALLIGLSIGAFFSFRNTMFFLDDSHDGQRLTAPRVLRDFSYMQYKNADHEHANAALLTYANFLEELQKTYPENPQKGELAVAYTRLALLEDAANNQEQSRTYITKARSWYSPIVGGRELSDSEMKFAVNKMDAWMQ